MSATWQWMRDGLDINGAIGPTYVARSSDRGKTLSFRALTPPTNTTPPTATGTPKQGKTLTGKTGSWSSSPMSFLTQWTRNGVNIDGATSTTYLITNADLGKTLAFRVTAINDAGSTTAVSNGVFVPQSGSSPVISGTPATSVAVGASYSFTPSVTGGQTPYVFAISAGSLPAGLALNTSTGAITGTATTAQVRTGIVETVTDANGAQSSLSPWDITVFASGTAVTPSTLAAALAAAAPGAVLTMAAGTYALDLNGINKAAPGVTLQGQSGVNAPFLAAQNCSGLNFDSIAITSLRTGQYGAYVISSDRISITNTTQAGNNPGAVHTGSGFFTRSSTNIVLSGNDIQNIGTAIGALDTTNLTISGNTIDKFSSNGIFWASIHNAVIEKNKIGTLDFLTPGDHPDGIQGASTGTTGRSSDVVVRYNNLNAGNGVVYQGSGEYENHDRISVTSNVNFGVAGNGIFFSDCTNATASNNYMQGWTTGPAIYTRNGSNIVALTNNFAEALPFSLHQPPEPDSTNVTISGNTIIPAATGPTDTTRLNAFLAANPQIPV